MIDGGSSRSVKADSQDEGAVDFDMLGGSFDVSYGAVVSAVYGNAFAISCTCVCVANSKYDMYNYCTC